jgi:hypothetical protein
MTAGKHNSSPATGLQDNLEKNDASTWRQRKSVRLSATVGTAIVVLAVALLSMYWPFSHERVARSIEEEFAGKVTIGHFHTTVFPHPGGVAEDVEFHWATKSPDKTPLATVKKLKVEANYWDLLVRPGYVARVVLEGLQVHVPPVGSETRPMDIPTTNTRTRVGEVIADDALLQIAR